MKIQLLIIALLVISSILCASDKIEISVFYKEKPPSQKILAKVDSLLTDFKAIYQIQYFNIEAEENTDLILKFGLPVTHFPFAIVINGKFTAEIEDKIVSFVHFPLFMKGIGRHEGNWSIKDLMMVLENNSLLSEKNILPVLDENIETSECED